MTFDAGLVPAPAVRVAIIDDEPVARRGLRLMVNDDPEIVVVGESGGGAEAAALLAEFRPDLVFLDIQMPGQDGFALLAGLAFAPAVIFVTAHGGHALRAFEVPAVDYLLKPFDDARFAAALARGKGEVRRRAHGAMNQQLGQLLRQLADRRPAGGSPPADRILVRASGEIIFLKPEEIDWIEAEGDYMKIHVGPRTHLMRETMASLESRLDPQRFIRIHRSTIVNFDRLRKLTPSLAGDYAVVLQDGTRLRLSRGYHERLAPVLKLAR